MPAPEISVVQTCVSPFRSLLFDCRGIFLLKKLKMSPESTSKSPKGLRGFGARLKQARERAGMSVGQLATAVTCNRSYIYKLEQGDSKNPSPAFVALAATRLGVKDKWLMSGDGDRARDYEDERETALNEQADSLKRAVALMPREELRAALDFFANHLGTTPHGTLCWKVVETITSELRRRPQ